MGFLIGKIEESYRQKGKNKDEVPVVDFRQNVVNLQKVGLCTARGIQTSWHYRHGKNLISPWIFMQSA